MKRRACLTGILLFLTALSASPAISEPSSIRMGTQFGLTYLPFAVMEHEKLIEKQAKARGIGDVQVKWLRSAGGNVMNDALLSGDLDFVATGFPSFLVLWARGKGKFDIKALSSYGTTPLMLLTRDPNVKSIADFSNKNRIAVPAVKSSIQAILIQMAAEKQFGRFDKLDELTISRSHPDAAAALLSGVGEVDSHFSAPPYQYQELDRPGVRLVTTSNEIFGGPLSNGVLYLTTKFHDANPKTIAAVNAALREALELISRDKRRALEMYLAVSGDKISVEEALRTVSDQNTIFDAVPRGTMRYAEFMKRTGGVALAPKDWKEIFFVEAHDLPGN
ncbi:ABC transporter substrate-binding protein [Bradyrhizobium sp. LHD-71]|uniref:ABC transporter substrate-binding protein n=1 Tax=Bradyrhizobium sp. LHD-71 TaxID=3072141 RepID=UPI00280D2E7A|nr:ABC transporter substrate-binding protein [Bradyrhizobium sp. LHD-71]MDQ8731972.1 ABC transporter substrate-binding protein [Bradyrhizobium sp. LHD-71]